MRTKIKDNDKNYKIESDGSITITMKIPQDGSFLNQEEQIAAALAEAGRIATLLSLKNHDTDGEIQIRDNKKYSSRGEEKKSTKPPTGKLK